MNKTTKTTKNNKTTKPAASPVAAMPHVAAKSAVIPGTLPIEGATQNEKYMWLNNAQLQINPRIQRKLSTMRVEKIKENYSPLIANPIKVSFRDGKFYIFDGMHSRTALCGTSTGPTISRFSAACILA